MRYGRVRNKGYRVHQRCCQALSFPGSLVCVRKRKAHLGALWENTKRTRVRHGRGEKQRLSGSSALLPSLELFWFLGLCKKTQCAPGCAIGKHKARPGALWEGEKQRLSGSSALLPSFEPSWFLGLCKKTQSAPACAMGNTKRTRVRHGRVRNKGYRVHQRCCQVWSFSGSLVCVRKRKAHPGALWGITKRTRVR